MKLSLIIVESVMSETFRPQTQPNWVYLLLQHAIDYNQDSNGQRADHTYQENGYN